MAIEKLTFFSMHNGAGQELFEKALEKVLNNIMDINTLPTEPREITLKFRCKPNDSRTYAATELTVTTKLARDKSHKSEMFIDKVAGKWEALQRDPEDVPLPLNENEPDQPKKEVIKFKKAGNE